MKGHNVCWSVALGTYESELANLRSLMELQVMFLRVCMTPTSAQLMDLALSWTLAAD